MRKFGALSLLVGFVMLFMAVAPVFASGGPDWDRSSLRVNGGCSDGVQSFTITNVGDRAMAGTSSWELHSLTKDGAVLETGSIPALGVDESYTLTFSYDFKVFLKVYQRPGHPGQGVAWADSESCNVVPTFTLTSPATATSTESPTATTTMELPTGTVVIPTGTLTPDPTQSATVTVVVVSETSQPTVTVTTEVLVTATRDGLSCPELWANAEHAKNNGKMENYNFWLTKWLNQGCDKIATKTPTVPNSGGGSGVEGTLLFGFAGLVLILVGYFAVRGGKRA